LDYIIKDNVFVYAPFGFRCEFLSKLIWLII